MLKVNALHYSFHRLFIDLIFNFNLDGCPVLFLACKKGNLNVVKFLIESCDADPEQIGIYEVLNDRTIHRVTPLWAAAVSGNLNVVEYLVLEARVDGKFKLNKIIFII